MNCFQLQNSWRAVFLARTSCHCP